MLNKKFMDEISKNHKIDSSLNLTKFTNQYIKKINNNLDNFSYNVLIANLHEMYSYLSKELLNNYTNKTLRENYNKILLTMLPIIPHFASECLEINKFENKFDWPSFDQEMLGDDIINIVVQINGKKEDYLKLKKI